VGTDRWAVRGAPSGRALPFLNFETPMDLKARLLMPRRRISVIPVWPNGFAKPDFIWSIGRILWNRPGLHFPVVRLRLPVPEQFGNRDKVETAVQPP
jgi:hypothetical protein